MKILVANIGSTSFEYKLFGMAPFGVLAQVRDAVASCRWQVVGFQLQKGNGPPNVRRRVNQMDLGNR